MATSPVNDVTMAETDPVVNWFSMGFSMALCASCEDIFHRIIIAVRKNKYLATAFLSYEVNVAAEESQVQIVVKCMSMKLHKGVALVFQLACKAAGPHVTLRQDSLDNPSTRMVPPNEGVNLFRSFGAKFPRQQVGEGTRSWQGYLCTVSYQLNCENVIGFVDGKIGKNVSRYDFGAGKMPHIGGICACIERAMMFKPIVVRVAAVPVMVGARPFHVDSVCISVHVETKVVPTVQSMKDFIKDLRLTNLPDTTHSITPWNDMYGQSNIVTKNEFTTPWPIEVLTTPDGPIARYLLTESLRDHYVDTSVNMRCYDGICIGNTPYVSADPADQALVASAAADVLAATTCTVSDTDSSKKMQFSRTESSPDDDAITGDDYDAL